MGQHDYKDLTRKHNDGSVNWTGAVKCLPERLAQPLGWKKPARVFVNSMSDLFHEAVPNEFIWRVFALMAATPRHTFQILTKRPERMNQWVRSLGRGSYRMADIAREAGWSDAPVDAFFRFPLPNVWLGVSTENQAAADERIPLLLQTPAAVRFISAEPLIGPIRIRLYLPWSPAAAPTPRLDWVITGGESGKDHRPFDPQWAKDIRDQCVAAGVAFFHKQSGGPRPGMGTELDGQEWHQFPKVAVPV
jgi:protein gp37